MQHISGPVAVVEKNLSTWIDGGKILLQIITETARLLMPKNYLMHIRRTCDRLWDTILNPEIVRNPSCKYALRAYF